MVESGWGGVTGPDPFSSICRKISHTREVLLKWSRHKFGQLKDDIAKLCALLAFFYDSSTLATPGGGG